MMVVVHIHLHTSLRTILAYPPKTCLSREFLFARKWLAAILNSFQAKHFRDYEPGGGLCQILATALKYKHAQDLYASGNLI